MEPPTPEPGVALENTAFENEPEREPMHLSSRPAASASVCSICLEQLTSGGAHQLCCLRCGHIFGRSCLERWLRHQRRAPDRCCPECKQRAALSDIRLLYLPLTENSCNVNALEGHGEALASSSGDHVPNASSVVRLTAKDLDEREELHKSLQMERKRRVQMELELCRLRHELELHQKSERIAVKRVRSTDPAPVVRSTELTHDETQLVSDAEPRAFTSEKESDTLSASGGLGVMFCGQTRCRLQRARIALLHEENRCLYVSTAIDAPKGNHKTESYTLREIPLELISSVAASSFETGLHAGAIRDIASNGKLLACASLDGSVSLVQPKTLLSVANIPIGEAAWSVGFTANWEHGLAIGSQRGRLLLFDLRQTQVPLSVFCTTNPTGGVHSIFLGTLDGVGENMLAFCTLRSLFLTRFSPQKLLSSYELNPQDLSNLLPKPAQLYCMRIHDHYLMLSKRFGTVDGGEHMLARFDGSENQFAVASRVAGFDPGPLLSRTDFCLSQHPQLSVEEPMPLLLSGDAGRHGALCCWIPGVHTKPQYLTLGKSLRAAEGIESTPNVFAERRLGLFAAVTADVVSLFRWHPAD